MRAIARASLMRAKNTTRHLCLWHLLSGTLEWKKWNKGQKHQIDHFLKIFVILLFAWMLYFHVLYDFRIREKFKVWSEHYN